MAIKHVLVIDDEGYWLDMMEMLLYRLGYQATLTENADEGLTLLKENPQGYGTVLLDLMMPMMSGLEFLQEMAKDVSLSHIQVILQTGSQNHTIIQEALHAGAQGFLQKPFDLSDLAAALDANSLID